MPEKTEESPKMVMTRNAVVNGKIAYMGDDVELTREDKRLLRGKIARPDSAQAKAAKQAAKNIAAAEKADTREDKRIPKPDSAEAKNIAAAEKAEGG